MDRRGFLRSAAYFTVVGAGVPLAACGGSDGTPSGSFTFPLGVASGDPKETSAVFWTRCLPKSGSGDANLRLDVASDAAFANIVALAELKATATYDHTVRAKVTGLSPNTRYWYRFVAGTDVSAIGQTKTAPAAASAPTQLRFAWMTCQDWSINHWAAMELMAQEDLDFIVHLGDYIYETVGAAFQTGAAEPAHGKITLPNGVAAGGAVYANTVDDYRTLYRTYRGDARLQELHRKFPMVVIWDDHEFSDDCWRDHQTYTNANLQQTARRRAANQAWAEYMPVDWGDVSFDLNNAAYDNIRIYRDFKFGNLLHLVMTDERLYRDDHVVSEAAYAQMLQHDAVNGSDSVGSRYFVPQPLLLQYEQADTAALGRAPSILGATQEQWWKDTMKNATATWKVWGNEVTLNRMWVDLRTQAPAPYNQLYVVNADGWDGYPAHRAELLGWLGNQGIKNVVAITGDLHAFQCGVIYDNNDPASGKAVAVDFVSAGISSSSFYKYLSAGSAGTPLAPLVATPQTFDGVLRANNPAFAYVDHDAQGYSVATVTPASFSVVFNKVKPLNADGSKPSAPLAKKTRIVLQAGSTVPTVTDNVS
ncbi:alkaline phosphatase D family protein [Massilia sp. YIM B02763]|uniref:alkaline phosphatase D family protein n=1 Tax=Massilia sp. YIM B02763 TaxID=3050130 RepID=UPI0025B6D9E2|nr:alkaline phosphatase D family protein [Massilia sp. YIM B02763]MDN4051931.1 alkaline phosphatase D family protein [Massilia sp. YIM B02763]